MFNPAFYRALATEIGKVYPALDEEAFYAHAIQELDTLELKDRMRRATETCRAFLPPEYPAALEILKTVAPQVPTGFVSIFFPDFVALYGLDHFELSMEALKYFTPFSSAEFAIREFLRQDFDRTIQVMYQWAEDEDPHVRRLASEGSRPRLPWSFQLKNLVEDPSPAFPILEKLNQDPELYVRKSVANHLNDISKDHPEKVLAWIRTWDRSHPHTEWIVKQGARTLIKQGHPGALELRGFSPDPQVEVLKFTTLPESLQLGETLQLAATLRSTSDQDQQLAIDYSIHYVKKSGNPSEKVFKWKEMELPAGATVEISKKQVVKDFSTRKHYPGFHRIELIINGQKPSSSGFELVES